MNRFPRLFAGMGRLIRFVLRPIPLLTVGVMLLAAAGYVYMAQPITQPGQFTTPLPSDVYVPAPTVSSATPTAAATSQSPKPSRTSHTPTATKSAPAKKATASQKPALAPKPVCTPPSSTGCVIWPDMGVNAPIELVGLDYSEPQPGHTYPLGTPVNKHAIGWYENGPAPCSRVGNVILDGHTYHDGSAVFKLDFAQHLHKGSVLTIITGAGAVCSYRVVQVYPSVTPGGYSDLVTSQQLYRTSGPAGLMGVTCADYDPRRGTYLARTVFYAVPIS